MLPLDVIKNDNHDDDDDDASTANCAQTRSDQTS